MKQIVLSIALGLFSVVSFAQATAWTAPKPPVCPPGSPASHPCVVEGSVMTECAKTSKIAPDFSACMKAKMPGAMAAAKAAFGFVPPKPPMCNPAAPALDPCVVQAGVMKECGVSAKNMGEFDACMKAKMPGAGKRAQAKVELEAAKTAHEATTARLAKAEAAWKALSAP